MCSSKLKEKTFYRIINFVSATKFQKNIFKVMIPNKI